MKENNKVLISKKMKMFNFNLDNLSNYMYNIKVFFQYLIILFIPMFITILIHELGHLFFALLNHIPIQSFNIGFGSTLLSTNISFSFFNNFIDVKNLPINLNMIPLGGFVELVSLPENSFGNILNNFNFFQMFTFVLGGVFFNFLTLFFILYFLKDKNSIYKYGFLFDLKVLFYKIFKGNNVIEFYEDNYFKHLVGYDDNEKISIIKLPLLIMIMLFSMLLIVINIIPILPLDGGQFILWIFHHIDIIKDSSFQENLINFYTYISFTLFIILFIYGNSPTTIKHRINSFILNFMEFNRYFIKLFVSKKQKDNNLQNNTYTNKKIQLKFDQYYMNYEHLIENIKLTNDYDRKIIILEELLKIFKHNSMLFMEQSDQLFSQNLYSKYNIKLNDNDSSKKIVIKNIKERFYENNKIDKNLLFKVMQLEDIENKNNELREFLNPYLKK
jgi:hypothetical protein